MMQTQIFPVFCHVFTEGVIEEFVACFMYGQDAT